MLIPMAAQSKARIVLDGSVKGIVGKKTCSMRNALLRLPVLACTEQAEADRPTICTRNPTKISKRIRI